MYRSLATPLQLALGLMAALALSACSREEASDPALESDRSARAEADASERHPVAASQESGAGRYAQESGDASSQVAARDPLDVLDPRQKDVPSPAEDPAIAAQAARDAGSDAKARCATLAPRERSDCESYAMSEADDGFEDESESDTDSDSTPPADDDGR